EAEDPLTEIGGTAPRNIQGASGAALVSRERSVKPEVHRILVTAGGDLDQILRGAGAAMLGVLVAEAPKFWNSATHRSAWKAFKSHGLRWVAASAIEAARDKMQFLAAESDWVPAVVKELTQFVGKALFKEGLTRGLGWTLESARVVRECD